MVKVQQTLIPTGSTSFSLCSLLEVELDECLRKVRQTVCISDSIKANETSSYRQLDPRSQHHLPYRYHYGYARRHIMDPLTLPCMSFLSYPYPFQKTTPSGISSPFILAVDWAVGGDYRHRSRGRPIWIGINKGSWGYIIILVVLFSFHSVDSRVNGKKKPCLTRRCKIERIRISYRQH
ncbi:hypothetical protein GYMLUDRAFT_252946 [Collybiopsis luxurians FD-317 M1]|uniref:Uncharacterized protein n=1 Tax=Collybiopsis luxurians FD-317 M1 TaxID=944289 RepID=A0A0D0C716_9AGAR|nr:hypothetical protein GYMLUDRAFT_252946 [Collybiopsis luxurians FD-317 M1]